MMHYDILYVSKIFNFTPGPELGFFFADKIVRGGTGYSLTTKLPDEVDRLQPDYSIYPNIPQDTAYGFLTRGCPNKCPWCVVPRKEGKVMPYMDIDEIMIEGRTKAVLMDNNILASGEYGKEQLRKIIERGYHVDFNQAMDARLVTEEWAQLLAKAKWIDRRIRFGCDTTPQIKECKRAIEMINSYRFKGEYFLYTMIGGKNDFNECYNRLNYWRERLLEYRKTKVGSLVHAYAQPYRNPDNPRQIIPQWQKDMAGWCNKKMIFYSTPFKDFEPRKGFKCSSYFED